MADPNPSYIEISDDDTIISPTIAPVEDQLRDGPDAELPAGDDPEGENDDDDGDDLEEEEEVEDDEEEIEEDEEDSEDDEDDDEDEEEGEAIDADYAVYLAQLASRMAQNYSGIAGATESRDGAEEAGEKRRRIGGPETSSSDAIGSGEGSQGNEWNRGEIDGLFCSICLDAWTNEGDHCICCLPCGHIFGMSCINKWLLSKNSPKCPQCNQKCKLKDVRKLFASRVVSVDEESHKRIRALEDKCASLEMKVAAGSKKEAQWLKREAELKLEVQRVTESLMQSLTTQLDDLRTYMQERVDGLVQQVHGMEATFERRITALKPCIPKDDPPA